MISKLTLQKQIRFWQPEQPSMQSVWHGQAEYLRLVILKKRLVTMGLVRGLTYS